MADSNGKVYISTGELKNVVNSLKAQRDTLKNTYNNQIKKVLESSQSCFRVAGLDYSRIDTIFNETFTSLEKRFNNLINVLERDVIQSYSELSQAIQQMFGSSFADRLTQLLGLK